NPGEPNRPLASPLQPYARRPRRKVERRSVAQLHRSRDISLFARSGEKFLPPKQTRSRERPRRIPCKTGGKFYPTRPASARGKVETDFETRGEPYRSRLFSHNDASVKGQSNARAARTPD